MEGDSMSLSDQVKSIDFKCTPSFVLDLVNQWRMQQGGGGEMKQSPQMRKHPLHVHAFLSRPE